METLTKASHRLAEVMYKQARPGGAESGGDGKGAEGKTKPSEGEVVDAEFEDLGKK